MAGGLPAPLQAALRLLLLPSATDPVLRLAGSQAEDLDPLLRNTATATFARAGEAWNVLPTEAQIDLDRRLVPGHEPAELLDGLATILPDDTSLESGCEPEPEPNQNPSPSRPTGTARR